MKNHQCSLRVTVIVLVVFITNTVCEAKLKLPAIFGDDMILQRDKPVFLWGWSNPKEQITVKFSGQSKTAIANENGEWRLKLDRMPINKTPQAMKIKGENQVIFKNILIGDVWLCSGQSNMEFPVSRALNSKKEIMQANYPEIRHIVIKRTNSPCPLTDFNSKWKVCSPKTVGTFTAVGYFFGRKLHHELDVPIGLIHSSWGGSRIEPWIPPAGFNAIPELKNLAKQVDSWDPNSERGNKKQLEYVAKTKEWAKLAEVALNKKQYPPPAPKPPVSPSRQYPTKMYNGMIHPLVPLAIRGVIWYQGESNGNEGESYYHKMHALVKGWRQIWNDSKMPFYWVQLANFQLPNPDSKGGDGWAKLREASRSSKQSPRSAQYRHGNRY